MNLASLSGSMIPESRGRWTAAVDISIEDQDDNPEAGVTIDGSWSNGTSGSVSCITVGGTCTVQKTRLKQQVTGVTFTVNNLIKEGLTYKSEDNISGDSIIVGQSTADNTPGAVDDSYQTGFNTQLNGNVMANDDQGDGPASASVVTFTANGSLSLSADGAFTYTPQSTFEGIDSFTYNITDVDGDTSNTATVNVTVASDEPPPPAGDRSVSARPYKVKGIQHVELTWQNFPATGIDIYRDDSLVVVITAGDGIYDDNIRAKGSGQYNYRVCDTGTENCASVSAVF
jgi:hypothetical protein